MAREEDLQDQDTRTLRLLEKTSVFVEGCSVRVKRMWVWRMNLHFWIQD